MVAAMKKIWQCRWFGFSGSVSEEKLLLCGCERCLQEIEQQRFLAAVLRGFATNVTPAEDSPVPYPGGLPGAER